MHTYTHAYHTHAAHTYIYTHRDTPMRKNTYEHIHTYIHRDMYMHNIHTHTYTQAHIYKNTQTHTVRRAGIVFVS